MVTRCDIESAPPAPLTVLCAVDRIWAGEVCKERPRGAWEKGAKNGAEGARDLGRGTRALGVPCSPSASEREPPRMTNRSPVSPRLSTRRKGQRRLAAGVVALAGLGAVLGASIAGATSTAPSADPAAMGPATTVAPKPPDSCTITARAVNQPVAVILDSSKISANTATDKSTDNAKTETQVNDGMYNADTVGKLKDALETYYGTGMATVYSYNADGDNAKTPLAKVDIKDGKLAAVKPPLAVEVLKSAVVVNYSVDAANAKTDTTNPFADVAGWDDQSESSSPDLDLAASSDGIDRDQMPGIAAVKPDTDNSLVPGDVVAGGSAATSASLDVNADTTTGKLEIGTDTDSKIDPAKTPVRISGAAVQVGGRNCTLVPAADPFPTTVAPSLDPSTATSLPEAPGSIALILPAMVTWQGGSGPQTLSVTANSGSNLVNPTVGNVTTSTAITTTPESVKGGGGESSTTQPASGKGSSTGTVALGGVVGLIVGGGVGAAAMGSRRRKSNADTLMNGRGVAMASGPPNPYGAGAPTTPGTQAPGAHAAGHGAPPPAPAWSQDAPGGTGAEVPAIAGSVGAKQRRAVSAAWTAAVPGGSAVRLDDVGSKRLIPVPTEVGRVWSMGRADCAATAGWFEKRAGKGEDAEPTLRVHANGRGLIGVYDGTGGAGAATARTTSDGTELSGAWLASRLTRDVVEGWFVDAVAKDDWALETGELVATLQKVLNDEAASLPSKKTAVRGSLHRVLPTTAALVAFDAGAQADRSVDAIWAGDSRAFLLTPDGGLQVLSRDDTREDDALELIRNDQPMENLIEAERPFRLNHRRFDVPSPMVVLTATDGAFGYVRTPAHFEYLLLHALSGAASMEGWSTRLLASISEFAADDVSYSIAAIGFDSFAQLKASFASREQYLANEHWAPFVENSGDADAIERLRVESWQVYRDLYGQRLAGPDASVTPERRPAGQ